MVRCENCGKEYNYDLRLKYEWCKIRHRRHSFPGVKA
jgi:hypothetical protein